ncbi:MAG TPA: insulinase family protein, partial [Gemmatimonadaceae bacterium]|nr:insulinase family protein [Gemmatimonadaceae bacterium]
MKNRLSVIRFVAASAVCAACELSAPWRPASAQGAGASRRPNVPPPPPFHFPPIHEHVLPNGVRLLVVEDHSIPLVSARVILPDASTDPIGKEGLDSLMIGALREGTSSKDATQLAESFADIGATIQPTRFTVTTDAAPAAMTLVADMLMHPSFDSAGIGRRRASQAATARAMAGIPSFAARHLFHAIVYGPDEDAVRALLVSDARVDALTRDDIVAHYRRFVGPKTTTIVLAGDLSDASASTLVTRVFGTWTSPAEEHGASTGVASPKPTTIYLYDAPAATDAFFVVGNAAAPRTTPLFAAADVVGAVASMRMQQLMRERRSLMYSGSSGMLWPAAPRPSALVGSTRFPAAKADTALTTWLGLLRDLHSGQ